MKRGADSARARTERSDAAFPALALVIAVSSFTLGCPLPGGGSGDGGVDDAALDAPDSTPLSDAPSDALVVDGAATDADAGSVDATIDSTIADADAATIDAAPDVELPPPDAQACGSGWRTLNKECDGYEAVDAGLRRGCSGACQVLDLLAHAPVIVDGGPPVAGRSLGAGRHPIAVTDDGRFAVAYVETQPHVGLSLTHFSRRGTASDVVTLFSGGSTPVFDSNPVLAGLPGGGFAAAYAEFGGDGDELGIALRAVTPGTPPAGAPSFANQRTQFSQYDPDAIFSNGQLVVAWIDNSDPATAPDVRYRTFDANLAPTSNEQTLAATTDAESDVALAPFAGSWAAAWRAGNGTNESVRVLAGNAAWSVGPIVPGPSGEKPALVEIDSTHLLAVFSVGVDTTDSGTANGSKLQGAILDTTAPGAVIPFDIPGGTTLAQSEPNAMRVGSRVYIAWRTERPLPDPNGYAEELWIKEVVWSGSTLDLSHAEITLPRWDAHRAGGQRHAALAASALPVEGALVTAWDDLGGGFGVGEGAGDVVVELIPAPPLRMPGGDGGP